MRACRSTSLHIHDHRSTKGDNIPTIDALLGILELRYADAGWKVVGTPTQQERVWHYLSFDPTAEKDQLPKHEGRRYRHVTLPHDSCA